MAFDWDKAFTLLDTHGKSWADKVVDYWWVPIALGALLLVYAVLHYGFGMI